MKLVTFGPPYLKIPYKTGDVITNFTWDCTLPASVATFNLGFNRDVTDTEIVHDGFGNLELSLIGTKAVRFSFDKPTNFGQEIVTNLLFSTGHVLNVSCTYRLS